MRPLGSINAPFGSASFASVSSDVRTLAQARLPLGDTVVVERALSQNTQPSPTAGNGLASVRPLAAPTRRELEALAEIFDQYRAHYGEPPDTSRSARWLDENLITSRLRTFVAEDRGRFVGFAITMEVPASLRLAHFWQIKDLFVLPTHRRLGVGRALLASVRAAAIESGRAAPGLADGGRQRPRSSSLRRQRLHPDQRLLLTDAAARPRPAVRLSGYPRRRAPLRGHSRTLAQPTRL